MTGLLFLQGSQDSVQAWYISRSQETHISPILQTSKPLANLNSLHYHEGPRNHIQVRQTPLPPQSIFGHGCMAEVLFIV